MREDAYFYIMKILFNFIVLVIALGCQAGQTESAGQTVATPMAVAAPAVNDSIPFPVYLSFDAFEPLLYRTDDTVYVFNFWATWCKPCIAEMPYFEKLIPAYSGMPVKVLLVSMDFPKDIQRKLVPFVVERKLAPHVVALADLDYNAWIDKVSTQWDGAIPFTMVFNQKSRSVKLGELSGYEELEAMVRKLLD